ncbi:MAG: hypothetical protein CSA07_00365 [Bacteroidia bacterium]|nr:MAG: hypothetical protein CSA07_00365 [Bacteroidia bacterium]
MRASQGQVLSHVALVIQSFIIGFSFYFLKVALASAGNDAFDVVAYRFSAALLAVVLLWVVGVGRPTGIGARDWLSILGVSMTYPVVFFLLQTVGVAHTSASVSGMLYSITPVITLLGAALFIGERASRVQMVGIGISVLGLAYLILGGGTEGAGQSSLLGVLLILLSVVALAAYFITVRRLSQRVDAMKLTCAMLVVGAVVFNIISIARHASSGTMGAFFTPLGHMDFIWASLYLGVVSSLVVSWISNFALIHLQASMVSVYNNVIPIAAAIGGYFLLGEQLFDFQLIGTLVVIVGVCLVLFGPQAKPRA